jgi:hypothetical protein
MLVKLIDHAQRVDVLKKQYLGTVVSNTDPKQLGRVKCTVPGLFTGDATTLPWVYPKNPAGQGGRADTGGMEVPEVDSTLIIEFPFGDIYSPFYTGFWQSEGTHQGTFNEDYPFSYGSTNANGDTLKTNIAAGFTEYEHHSGSYQRFNKDGSIELSFPNFLNLTSTDGQTAFKLDAVDGSFVFKNRNKFDLGGQLTRVSSKRFEIDTGSVVDKAKGSREITTLGGFKHLIGGGASESIVSDKAISIGGNYNVLVSQKSDRTYGLDVTETLAAGDYSLTIMLGNRKVMLTAGNHEVTVILGDIVHTTAAGKIECSNPIGKMTISATGDLEFSNTIGKLTVAATGDIALENAVAQLTGSATGEIALKNAVGKVTIATAGDFAVENAIAKLTGSAAGEVVLANAVGKLKISPAGMIGMGGAAAELLDLFDQTLDAFINQPNLTMTSTGPSGPLMPPAMVNLIKIKVLLATIKGSV